MQITSGHACHGRARSSGIRSPLPFDPSSSTLRSRPLKVIQNQPGSLFPKVHLTARSAPKATNSLATTAAASPSDYVKFVEMSKKGNLIPLYRCIFSDHLTPVLVYRRLVSQDDRDAPSFLFESAGQGQNGTNEGRFSIVGAQPAMEIVAKENSVTIMDNERGTRKKDFTEDPMTVPPRIMSTWKPVLTDELPITFCGGWIGYFSYDTVRYVEKEKLPFSKAPVDDRGLPDMHLGLYNDVVVFDNVEKTAYVIHWVRVDDYSSPDEAFKDGQRRLDILVSRVEDIDLPRLSSGSIKQQTGLFGVALKESSMTSEQYKKAVVKAQEHILSGDISQIFLSLRIERCTSADPFEVYRALRVVKPSPYMIYLQARGCILVASSPEILPRVKQVTGELQENLTSWDALRTALPVGTVSGVPKVKAMEVIDEIEPTRRGPYSGGIGGVPYTGDMDIALALRTMVFSTVPRYDTMYSYKDVSKRRDWVVHLQAGAGIVADSNPDDEHRECIDKAAGLGSAIDDAEATFVNT